MALTAQQLARLAPRLWSDGLATYALLDGAGIPNLLDKLDEADGLDYACLYSGELEPDIAEVAPYLARLEPGSAFAEWVAGAWGEQRGIFAQVGPDTDMGALRRHFRKLNMVYGPDADPLLFRYYDPRVLRMFLPTCDPAQVREVFGPVQRFLAEGPGALEGMVLSAHGDELMREPFTL
jgi:hypothetical protein